MILVKRICKECGRSFKIEHTPGSDMPAHCPDLACSLAASLRRTTHFPNGTVDHR